MYLCDEFAAFKKAFRVCYSISGISTFRTCLARLKADFPEIVPYFNNHLDLHEEKWAAAFREGVFTAGMNSTQRGEGMNARLKATLKSSGRLMAVLGAIDDQLTDQKKAAETREAVGKCINTTILDTPLLVMVLLCTPTPLKVRAGQSSFGVHVPNRTN